MALPALSLNWLAILLSVVVSMALGFVFYSRATFGTKWMAWVGIHGDPPKDAAMRAVGVALAMAIVAVVACAMVLSWTGAKGFAEGALVGVVLGALAGAVAVVHPTFEMRPAGVGMLYAAHHVVEFAIVGAILGAFA